MVSTPQLLDSLTVIPYTVEVTDPATGRRLPAAGYRMENNRILFDTVAAGHWPAVVRLRYRVLPFDLSAPFARLDSSVFYKNKKDYLIGVPYDPYAGQQHPLTGQKGLDYSGNYTRGLSFGNNQNLVLNSQFNLQMAGRLGDLEVLAAITDNSIPLQPEGNTQQLREFDKIFVQIKKDQNTLIAGDYELGRPRGYFMNFNKKLQGATFSKRWKTKNSKKPKTPHPALNTRFSIASARGKFARNTIAAREGNQGPYRLEGAEGERFIIVLSGTEKVFLNGEVLTRGLDADYVIDYNAGHITFTNRRLITKDSRIVVEFDYNVQDYQRSLYAFNGTWANERLRLYLNTYSEQDGRRPIDGAFSQQELQALQLAGDADVIINSIDTVDAYDPFRVLYLRRDTTVGGVIYKDVLVFSNDPSQALYAAGFSLVGPGNGNYVQDTRTPANGRVFRWVAPDSLTGEPTGNYQPVRRLIAPNRQQLYTAGLEFSPNKKTTLRAEAALSHFDQNRLSSLDDDDNSGLAASFGIGHLLQLGKKNNRPAAANPWQLRLAADYEYAAQKFKELNPYRPPEFARDWNVNSGANDVAIGRRPTDEHLLSAGATLHTPGAGTLHYQFGGFFRDTLYQGGRHFGKYVFQKKGWDVWAQTDWLTTRSTSERSTFFRPKFNFAVPFLRDTTGAKYWSAGIYAERERNSRFVRISNAPDTLDRAGFFYDLAKAYIESPENEHFGVKVSYQRRKDHAPAANRFLPATTATEANVQGHWKQSRNSRLNWNFTYRQLLVDDEKLTSLDPSDTYLGRLNYHFNLLRGVVQSNTSYEIGSGQERKVEITYLQVPPGEGTHLWTDRNNDAQVQLDEVETAPFQDVANAVRVNVFTDDFIRTNNVVFNQSLRLEPKAVWFNRKGWRRFVTRFATQSSLQISRKVLNSANVSQWNPFQLDVADTALVAIRSSVFNTLFFNRGNPRFDTQIGQSDIRNKFVQTSGFEARRQQKHFLKIRCNVSRTLSFHASLTLTTDTQQSELFENRRYRIQSLETRPQLSFQPSGNFRTTLSRGFKNAENQASPAAEHATTHDLKWEVTYNRSATTSIRSQFSWINISFDGDPNSPTGFAFLQGLQNGKNFLWNITLDRQVAKNIRLGITYEGRKTGPAKMVHVGRAQVGAVF